MSHRYHCFRLINGLKLKLQITLQLLNFSDFTVFETYHSVNY